MSNQDVLIIREQEAKRLNDILTGLLQESQVKCALLISRRDGSLITQLGDTESLDTLSLAALAAAGFSATKEIARLVGEPEFSVLFHQGEKENIHLSIVGEEGLLMLLFDDHSSIGLVRILAKEAGAGLAAALSGAPA